MKQSTAQRIIVIADLCAIITLVFTVAFIWYYVEPIKVAANPFYAVSKIPGAFCTMDGIPVGVFLNSSDLKYDISDIPKLNLTIANKLINNSG